MFFEQVNFENEFENLEQFLKLWGLELNLANLLENKEGDPLMGAALLASKGLLLELKSVLRLIRVSIWGERIRTKFFVFV